MENLTIYGNQQIILHGLLCSCEPGTITPIRMDAFCKKFFRHYMLLSWKLISTEWRAGKLLQICRYVHFSCTQWSELMWMPWSKQALFIYWLALSNARQCLWKQPFFILHLFENAMENTRAFNRIIWKMPLVHFVHWLKIGRQKIIAFEANLIKLYQIAPNIPRRENETKKKNEYFNSDAVFSILSISFPFKISIE